MKQMFLGNLTMTVKWPSSILDLSNHQRLLLLPIRLGTGDSKRSLYNDQLPEPTEAENTAYRGSGLFLREEEPPGAEETWKSQCPLLPGCWPATSEKSEPGDCGNHQPAGDHWTRWVRRGVYAGRHFGNSRSQGWGPDWSIGLGSLQKIPTGSQDRKALSNPQYLSVRSGDLYWNETPYP